MCPKERAQAEQFSFCIKTTFLIFVQLQAIVIGNMLSAVMLWSDLDKLKTLMEYTGLFEW